MHGPGAALAHAVVAVRRFAHGDGAEAGGAGVVLGNGEVAEHIADLVEGNRLLVRGGDGHRAAGRGVAAIGTVKVPGRCLGDGVVFADADVTGVADRQVAQHVAALRQVDAVIEIAEGGGAGRVGQHGGRWQLGQTAAKARGQRHRAGGIDVAEHHIIAGIEREIAARQQGHRLPGILTVVENHIAAGRHAETGHPAAGAADVHVIAGVVADRTVADAATGRHREVAADVEVRLVRIQVDCVDVDDADVARAVNFDVIEIVAGIGEGDVAAGRGAEGALALGVGAVVDHQRPALADAALRHLHQQIAVDGQRRQRQRARIVVIKDDVVQAIGQAGDQARCRTGVAQRDIAEAAGAAGGGGDGA